MTDPQDNHKAFWDWFIDHEDEFIELELTGEESPLLDELHDRLKDIHPELTFELGQKKQDEQRELIISADGIKEAFSSVIDLIQNAPEISDWKLTPFRPRVATVDDLELDMAGEKLAMNQLFFEEVEGEGEGELININIYVKEPIPQESLQSMIFILLDAAIGEYDTETKIGEMGLFAYEDHPAPEQLTPLPKLAEHIDNYFEIDLVRELQNRRKD